MTASTATPAVRQGVLTNLRPALRNLNVVFTYAVLILFALAMILPFIYSVANSFKYPPDISANPQVLLPDPTLGYTLDNYRKILSTDQVNFPRVVFNSFWVSAVVMVARIVFDSMAGYALARIRFPARGVAFALLVGTMMIPGIVLLIPRFLVFKQLSIVDTGWALVLPNLADAFGIFLMKQFFESIPGEIEEAAEIDGASRFRLFFTIILPMALPAITALAIFSFQGAWNDFTGPLIAVSGNKELYTLPLALAFLRGVTGSQLQWDLLLSGAVLTTVPMAIIFFIFQRFFIEGVSYSGVKG